VLTSTDLVNYMGGGVLFEIIEKKYNYNIYDALEKTAVESLVKKEPVWVGSDSRIDEVLRLMVEHGTGFLPVVDKSGTVAGVVTEHDLVKHLAGKETGRTVAEVMSRTVIGIDVNDTLWDAMKLMVKHGFRRLLVFREDKLEGSITAKSIVTFFGNHKAFEYVKTGDIRDVLNIEVAELYTPYYTVAKPNEDIGIVADRMMKTGLSGLPVVEDENVVGVVTERDVLFGLLSR
nr:CBS domain-containing protein [Desulfurococcales archaeon]